MTTSVDVAAPEPFPSEGSPPRPSRKRRAKPAPPAQSSHRPGERLDFVEGMRGLAALYVVLGHFVSMVDPKYVRNAPALSPPWMQSLMAPFRYGHLAVAAFIVISGFCLEFALFRAGGGGGRAGGGRVGSLRRFFARRARRILPAYYASLALSAVVTLTVTSRFAGVEPFDLYGPLTRENLVAHLFLVHNLSPEWMYKLNGVLWSIAIEAQLYLVFPLLAASLLKLGRSATVLLAAVAAWGLMALVPGSGKLYFWFLPLFALGMASAHLAFRPNLWRGTAPRLARWGGAALLGLAAWGVSAGATLVMTDLALGGAVAALLYGLTVAPGGGLARGLSWPPLVGLGTFSYSLYLVHSPLQQTLWLFRPVGAGTPEGGMLFLLAMLPLIVYASWLFSRAFEAPFMSGAQRRTTMR